MKAINEEISTRIISRQKEEIRKAKLKQLDKKNREIPM
jgi:hypothetical protein